MLQTLQSLVHDTLLASPEFWLTAIDALAYFAAAWAAIRGHKPWLAFAIYLVLFMTHATAATAHAYPIQHAAPPYHQTPSLSIQQPGPSHPRLMIPFPHR